MICSYLSYMYQELQADTDYMVLVTNWFDLPECYAGPVEPTIPLRVTFAFNSTGIPELKKRNSHTTPRKETPTKKTAKHEQKKKREKKESKDNNNKPAV